LELVNFLIKTG